MKRRAEAGIGTLILFIAMILVAAVAAGVLIQTANSLQSKALSTGSKAKTQVSTAILVNSIYAEDGSDTNIEDFFVDIKLAPGSDPIRLNDTLVEFNLKNMSQDMSNLGTIATCNAGNATTSGFYVEYITQGSNYRADYLQNGDVIKLCFESSRSVGEDEEFTITITPKTGSVTQVSGTTPEVMTVQKAKLFP